MSFHCFRRNNLITRKNCRIVHFYKIQFYSENNNYLSALSKNVSLNIKRLKSYFFQSVSLAANSAVLNREFSLKNLLTFISIEINKNHF